MIQTLGTVIKYSRQDDYTTNLRKIAPTSRRCKETMVTLKVLQNLWLA